MKTSRDQLKAIVKECLLEILSEGLGNVQAAAYRPPAPGGVPIKGRVSEQRSAGQRRPAFDPRLDTPLPEGRQPTDALKEAIQRNSGGNPLMADILADTAMTTLPTMMAHGDTGNPDGSGGPSISRDHATVQQEQFNGMPDEVFGGSSNWADLAFGPGDKKSM